MGCALRSSGYLRKTGLTHIRAGAARAWVWQYRSVSVLVAVVCKEAHYVGISIRVPVHPDADVARPQILDFVARKVGD